MKPSRTPQTGHDIPAEIGMVAAQVGTPSLVIDLEAFEHNVRVMGEFLGHTGVRLRAHAKTHKSVDISHYQINHGGACGMC